jgi:hypothetical protein
VSSTRDRKPRFWPLVTGLLGGCATCVGLCIAVVAILPDLYSILTRSTLPEAVGLSQTVRLTAHLWYQGPALIPQGLDPQQAALEWGSVGAEGWIRPTYNASGGNSLVLEVSSLAPEAMVAVETEVLFRVAEYSPVPEWTDVYAPYGMGGAAYYRNFVVTLDWNEDRNARYEAEFVEAGCFDLQGEAQRPSELAEGSSPDFFTLASGELERFLIELRFAKPGIYELLPGIEYTYRGEHLEEWLNEPVTAYVPGNYVVWTSFQGRSFRIEECRFRQATYYECEAIEEHESP